MNVDQGCRRGDLCDRRRGAHIRRSLNGRAGSLLTTARHAGRQQPSKASAPRRSPSAATAITGRLGCRIDRSTSAMAIAAPALTIPRRLRHATPCAARQSTCALKVYAHGAYPLTTRRK